MFVAVEGCSHGELDNIYEELARLEEQRGIKVSLLVCCGDFQAVRSYTDLECMAVPLKYRSMQDFYKYYTGKKVAPVLTIFIGGNHEASNHLQELYYGGWAAPNIYFLGTAGCVVVDNVLRVAGISGIFKQYHYLNGHFEFPPYDNNTCRSVYHYRNLEVLRLRLLTGNVDVMLSHDWPAGIFQFGDANWLARRKPHFRGDMAKGELGGWPLMKLLHTMQPRYWFAAHLHVSFKALVQHNNLINNNRQKTPNNSRCTTNETPQQQQSITNISSAAAATDGDPPVAKPPQVVDADADAAATKVSPPPRPPPPPQQRTTQFQALDKCLPRRHFLEVFEINPPTINPEADLTTKAAETDTSGVMPGGISRIFYDPEWLTILKNTDNLLSTKSNNVYMPASADAVAGFIPTAAAIDDMKRTFNDGDLEIKPEYFYRSVRAHEQAEGDNSNKPPPFVEDATVVMNEQTRRLCTMLKIRDPLQELWEQQQRAVSNALDDDPLAFLQEDADDNGDGNNNGNVKTAASDDPSFTSFFSASGGAARDIRTASENGVGNGKPQPRTTLPPQQPAVHEKIGNIEVVEDIPS